MYSVLLLYDTGVTLLIDLYLFVRQQNDTKSGKIEDAYSSGQLVLSHSGTCKCSNIETYISPEFVLFLDFWVSNIHYYFCYHMFMSNEISCLMNDKLNYRLWITSEPNLIINVLFMHDLWMQCDLYVWHRIQHWPTRDLSNNNMWNFYVG